MKNLKKILIALAVVALLVSSVAFIVSAEGEYTGELKSLYNSYKKVESGATANDKASALAEAYKYLDSNTIDPDSTYDAKIGGETVTLTYADVINMMKTSSVEIGELLYTAAEGAANAASRLAATAALMAHIVACPAEGTDGYAELVAKANAKNSAVVAEQYTLAESQTVLSKKKEAAIAITAHIASYPLDATTDADLIANIKAYALNVAVELYNAWAEISEDYTVSANYFARYNGAYSAKYYLACIGILVNNSVVSTATSDEKAAANNILTACQTMDAAKAQKQIALDAQASFEDYDFGGPYMTVDCQNSLMNSYNATALSYATAATDWYGNKYHQFIQQDATHLYTEPQVGTKNAFQLGMVVEFDLLLNDGFVYGSFVCREPSVGMVTPLTFRPGPDGINFSNSNSANGVLNTPTVTVQNAMVPNVWSRITLTYDDVTKTGKLYINYEYIFDVEYSDKYDFVGLRMGGDQSCIGQTIGYDNLTAMNGSNYRIWDKFEKMSNPEKFEYYVNYMVNSENPSLSRNTAYNKAKLVYADIKANYATQCAAALEAYENCNYSETIKKPAMAENLGILSGMVNELLAMQVTSGTTAEVNAAIAEIDSFVSVNGELINKGDTSEGGYQSLMMKVNTVKADLVKIENVIAFVEALKKFDRATTLASMTKYAEAAQAVYTIAAYNDPINVAFVENDPVVLSFEASINGEIAAGEEGYVTLFEYYETVAEKIALRSLYENSKRIISCMNFVTSMEGYEATVEFWTANAEYISVYVNIAREIVATGNYDASVAGVEDAIATFYALDVCFYELLQQQHIAVIEEQLAKYLATEIYIDKVGVCTVVAQYLADNDIAVYNTNMTPEVAAAVADEIAKLEELIIIYNVYNDELTAQADDYTAVLAQNTQYFINTINHMTTVLTYAELKPLFDKATGYYYSIDANGEEAAAAAEKYIAYREQLEAYETNGAIFVGFVNGLYEANLLEGVEREDAIYAILVDCIAYVDLVDEGVQGVASAMAAYESALNDYNAELDIINSDISESAKITCAVRTGSISTIVLAIVSKIFEN